MPAPLPAFLPPPAMAPPAAPTPAPTAPPIPASLTTSRVLSPAAFFAYWLHASTAAAVGAAAWRDEPFDAVLGFSPPFQTATTSPVTSAVTITRTMPIEIIFQGFQVCSDMAQSLLVAARLLAAAAAVGAS